MVGKWKPYLSGLRSKRRAAGVRVFSSSNERKEGDGVAAGGSLGLNEVLFLYC